MKSSSREAEKMKSFSRIIKAGSEANQVRAAVPYAEMIQTGPPDVEQPEMVLSESERESTRALFDAAAIVREASQRAARMVRLAAERAENIVAAATNRVEAIEAEARKAGYEEGFDAGFAAGKEEAAKQVREEMAQIFTALEKAVNDLGQERRTALARMESDIVKFAVLLAERVIRRQLPDPETTVSIAGSLLHDLKEESRVTIHLPPAVVEHPEVERRLSEVAAGSGIRWKIAADPSLRMGDVRIETEWGWVDGRASIRWSRLIRALEEAVRHDES